MAQTKLDELYFELTADIDAVDMKLKKVIFPVDENNFKDSNFLKLYVCSKKYRVLKKVCYNLIDAINHSKIKHKKTYRQQFEDLYSSIPTFDYDDLEICPEAEDLKLKYINYIKQDKINLEM